jgi:uncharacterized repeat protein (TIGR02543 family)
MEKIRLRLLWTVLFAIFSCALVFAQDDRRDKEPKTWTVTFESAGGSRVDSQKVEDGKTIDKLPPPPHKEGHDFMGWRIGIDADGETEFTEKTSINEDLTVQAKWEVKKYTVTFDTDGGEPPINDMEVEYNKPIVPFPSLSKSDHQFLGWSKASNEVAIFDENTPIKGDITLYAKWKPFSDFLAELQQAVDKHTNDTKEGIASIQSHNKLLLLAGGITALFLVLLSIFSVLTFLWAKKDRKKIQTELAAIKDKQSSNEGTLSEIHTKIKRLADLLDKWELSNTRYTSSTRHDDIPKINEAAERQAAELEKERNRQNEDEKTSADIANGRVSPKDAFNSWAANPASPLPKAFYYIAGDVLEVRTNFTINESSNPESKWIVNREGTTKYLFPNPNTFNQITNLSLYDMNNEKLKGRWQNRIRIIKACEIKDGGFIEFKGELEIL